MDRLDVLDVLRAERELLCELPASSERAAWARETECPAWTVKGVALHVLCDDVSLLASRGVSRRGIEEAVVATGDVAAARPLVAGMAGAFGSYDPGVPVAGGKDP